jgi:hypothetical protein
MFGHTCDLAPRIRTAEKQRKEQFILIIVVYELNNIYHADDIGLLDRCPLTRQ